MKNDLVDRSLRDCALRPAAANGRQLPPRIVKHVAGQILRKRCDSIDAHSRTDAGSSLSGQPRRTASPRIAEKGEARSVDRGTQQNHDEIQADQRGQQLIDATSEHFADEKNQSQRDQAKRQELSGPTVEDTAQGRVRSV